MVISPYEQGKQAYRLGLKKWENPYNRGTNKYVAWIRGYNEERVKG